MRTESQRRENSIFPSASVGTPLQVAGRYRQVRTVRRMLRSPACPALCRISGLCTRPSVPTMKLTFTIVPVPAATRMGSGVVSACGSRVSSQRALALTCGTSLYSTTPLGIFQTRRSFCDAALCSCKEGVSTEAVQSVHSEKKTHQSRNRDMSIDRSTVHWEPRPKQCSRAFAGPAIRQHETSSFQSIERSLSFAGMSDVKPIAYFMLRLVAALPSRELTCGCTKPKLGFRS